MEALDRLLPVMEEKMAGRERFLLAIDGRCGSGKTTLAAALAEVFSCRVIHMDEFFLRPHQRTAQRLSQPGGNVDYERFLREVLLPLSRGEDLSYRPYDCGTQSLLSPVPVEARGLTVIEGSYSCHPELRRYYDLRVFLTVEEEEQLARIQRRSPGKLEAFRERWIPLEERYFSQCAVESACELILHTDK